MTDVGYYPGCSLEATARDYAESVAAAAELLDVRLVEIEDWNCCGATAGHSLEHRFALNLGARNLAIAARGPQPLVVPCALCFNRLKTAQAELAEGDQAVTPSIAAMSPNMADAYANVEVLELNSFFSSPPMIELAKSRKVRDLSGLKPVVYYGCQGQRPPKITGHPDYEHPMGIDRLLEALGADVIDWQFKTDCCGASHAVSRSDLVHTLVARLYERALAAGANCIVTGCQMCQGNLDMYQTEIAAEMGRAVYLPVFYFTELIGLALGHADVSKWFRRHFVNPERLLSEVRLPAAGARAT